MTYFSKPYNPLYESNRSYYQRSLERNQTDKNEYWTNTPTKEVYPTSYALKNSVLFGGALLGIGAAGFIPTKTGNVWDYYVGGIRTLEEYSPSQILKTFQLSNIFSTFESSVRKADLFLSPEYLAGNQVQASYIASLIGETGVGEPVYGRILREGISLRKGKLYWGIGTEVALPFAGAIRGTGQSHIGSAYARSMGVNLKQDLGRVFISDQAPRIGDLPTQIIGGHTRLQDVSRKAGALGTELVSRFNRLLNAPFETEPFSNIFQGIQSVLKKTTGYQLEFAVKPGSGLQTLGRLGAKYGLAAGAIALGYQTADYMLRNASILDNTWFDQGLTTGIATGLVKGNLALSKAAEVTGLHAYRERQEEIAPGSTDLSRLMAFPLMGMFAAGVTGYGYKTSQMLKQQQLGLSASAARALVEEASTKWNTFGLEEFGKLLSHESGLYAQKGFLGKTFTALSKPDATGNLIFKGIGQLTPFKALAIAGGSLGLLAAAPFFPGALIPSQRPDELERIYSGQQEVPIRKGRWWLFGRSPIEGEGIISWLPHWYPRMLQRGRERSIWGENEEEISPLTKWFKSEFTYELEQKHYYDRPYPITSLPFEDVPLIGPLLANTIGRLIKPPKLMHTEEWQNQQGGTLVPGKRKGEFVATELGQGPGGMPISPYSPTQTTGEQLYRMTEMIGLPGFIGGSIKKGITGREEFFDQEAQLESARRMFGFERKYWEQELGDVGGLSEAFRRLYPHRRRQIGQYNPIQNQMPNWIPGAGDKSTDFRTGDPYSKIPFGDIRLPGVGYASRFPELEGVAPEDYPLVHQYKILSDIAPYSDKLKEMSGRISAARKSREWTEYEETLFKQARDQLAQKKSGEEFYKYQYLSETGGLTQNNYQSQLLAQINEATNAQKEKPSLFKRLFGGYWETLSHNAETSFDMLTPFSPGAKLIHMRSPIEAYEREEVYGTQNAFWDRPIENFLSPFGRSISNALGREGVPSDLQQRRELEEYFDMLKYVKAQRLANLAQANNDAEAVKEFETIKNQTLFGMNPFQRNFSNLFKALPRRDRDYFEAFSQAETIEERQRIFELVPDNQRPLYLAQWQMTDADKYNKAIKSGILNEQQIQEAQGEVEKIYEQVSNEGFPTSKELVAEYIATREPGENYPDWYRRVKILSGVPLPRPNWIGWHGSLDLEDVKLKVVENLGEDMHDYDLWPSRQEAAVNKPYLDEAAMPILENQLTVYETGDRIRDLMKNYDVRGQVFLQENKTGEDSVRYSLRDDREEDLQKAHRRLING